MNVLDLLTTAQLWASEAASHGAEHHGPSINDIWFPLGNFLIYAFIIVKLALPKVRDFLKTRREEVVSTITKASAKKQQAEAFVSEYKAKMAGLDNEIQTMQATLRDEGEREKTRLLGEARTLAAKISEDTQFLADQEVKIARQQLRLEMANQAEAAARTLIQRHLSAADQDRLAQDFIQNIGQTR